MCAHAVFGGSGRPPSQGRPALANCYDVLFSPVHLGLSLASSRHFTELVNLNLFVNLSIANATSFTGHTNLRALSMGSSGCKPKARLGGHGPTSSDTCLLVAKSLHYYPLLFVTTHAL